MIQELKQLEGIRDSINKEEVSYSELITLQNLIPFISKDDIQLLEAAGVPE